MRVYIRCRKTKNNSHVTGKKLYIYISQIDMLTLAIDTIEENIIIYSSELKATIRRRQIRNKNMHCDKSIQLQK